MTKHRIRLHQYEAPKQSLEDIIQLIDNFIRSSSSKIAFKKIQKLSIVHPQRRDGDIMKCYINKDNELIAQSNEVQLNCLRELSKYQNRIHDYKVIH